jgi:photosystem II stability/assembly factor-like uncharacterized protein
VRRAASVTSPPVTPAPPTAGMQGVVLVNGLAFASPQAGMISLSQCWPCRAAPGGGQQIDHNWLAATANDGRSWHVGAEPWLVSRPQFEATGNGWAQGVTEKRAAAFYVSHDDGRTWRIAPSASPSPGLGSVSVAGGEVWSFGESRQPTCNITIVHGAASGNRLTAAASQPVPGDALNLEVVAAGAGVVYLTNPDNPRQSFVTRNDGRNWQRFSPPCPRLAATVGLTADSPDSLWDACQNGAGSSVLRRSTDGGRHWTTYPIRFGTLNTIQPTTMEVAWAQTTTGHVVRTTDGGRSWSTVWTVSGSQPTTLAGHSPILSAAGTSAATVLVSLTHGHVAKQAKYTISWSTVRPMAGATWRPSVARLPSG